MFVANSVAQGSHGYNSLGAKTGVIIITQVEDP